MNISIYKKGLIYFVCFWACFLQYPANAYMAGKTETQHMLETQNIVIPEKERIIVPTNNSTLLLLNLEEEFKKYAAGDPNYIPPPPPKPKPKPYIPPSSPSEGAVEGYYSPSSLYKNGRISWGGYQWTWYSERILPGYGLWIPGRHTDANGFVCDENGYICLASGGLSKGTVVMTLFGRYGKVYDCGCPSYVLDVYVNW